MSWGGPRVAAAHALVALAAVGALCLGAAPLSSAQGEAPVPEPLALEVVPFPEPIAPLGPYGTTEIKVSMSCEAASQPAVVSRKVTVKVIEHLDWASVTISPSTIFFDVADPASCLPGSRVEQPVKLVVSTTADAPAFVPHALALTATAQDEDMSAFTNATVEAGFFSIIDASVGAPIREGPPGVTQEFNVTVTSFGNGDTRVSFAVAEVESGWGSAMPPPFVLGSTQLDSGETRRTVKMFFTPPPSDVYVEAPGILKVLITGEHAGGRSDERSNATLSVRVTARGTTSDGSASSAGALLRDLPNDAPLPASAAPVAFLAAAAAFARLARRPQR